MRVFRTIGTIVIAVVMISMTTAAQASDSPSTSFFPGFESFKLTTTSGIAINGVVGGDGPPILLIHGAPANLTSWRKMAPELAKRYTVVVTDLRGYGDSDMPDGGENHKNYAKRVMAQDQVDVMTRVGVRSVSRSRS